jgi:tape measure domain-containing protein
MAMGIYDLGTARGLISFTYDGAGLKRARDDVAATDKHASVHIGNIGRSLTSAGLMIGQIGVVAGAATLAVTAGIGAIGAWGLSTASQVEQADIAFSTMLGSAQKADAFLKQLADFAAKTPFEFPDLVSASQKLLAMGFQAQQVVPTLTAIGDAVAGLGGSKETIDQVTRALGQMQAKGKVQSDEMLQLTEAGIPAWQMLADKMGITVPQAMDKVSKGAVDAKTGIDALVTGMEKDFGGMMEKQSQTLSGLFSTLKDTVRLGLAQAEQGALPALKKMMQDLIVAAGPAMQSVGQFMVAMSPVISELAKQVGPLIGSLAQMLKQAGPGMADLTRTVFGGLGELIRGFAPAMPLLIKFVDLLAQGLMDALRALMPAMGPLLRIFVALTPVINKILLVLADLITKILIRLEPYITPIVDATMKLVDVFVMLIPYVFQLLDAFLPMLPAMLDLTKMFLDLFVALMPIIDPLLKLVTLMVAFNTAVTTFGIGILKEIIGAVKDAVQWLTNLDNLQGVWDTVTRAFSDAWNWIFKNVITPFVNFFVTLPGRIVGWLSTVWSIISSPFKAGYDWLVKNVFNPIVNFFTGLPDRIATGLGRIGNVLLAPFKAGAIGILKAINWLASRLKDIPLIGDLLPWSKEPLGGAIAWLNGLGLAAGGITRGPAIVGEGRSQYPEAVIPTDPRYRGNALELMKWLMLRLGLPGMAGGGIIGGAMDAVLAPIKALVDAMMSALGNPWNKLGSKLIDLILKQIPMSVGNWIVQGVLSVGDFITGLFTAGGESPLYALLKGTAAAAGGPLLNLGNVAMGQLAAAAQGWIGAQWDALYKLWMNESGWNELAMNPISGAYGIPQALPAIKMASAGADWLTSALTQIMWGIQYIKTRYGDPIRALAFWQSQSPHWYDSGGFLPSGRPALVGVPEMWIPRTSGMMYPLQETGRREAAVASRPTLAIENFNAYDKVDVDVLMNQMDFRFKRERL